MRRLALLLPTVVVGLSTRVLLSNLGSSYTAPLNLGTESGVFVISSSSGDVISYDNSSDYNLSNVTDDDECISMNYDQSYVVVYARNCSVVTSEISFGHDSNITVGTLNADAIRHENPSLHQWKNASGILGLGYEKCSDTGCLNRSLSPFQELLTTIYNTSIFGLDLNNNMNLSYLDIGALSSNYENDIEWSPRQIATYPQDYDLLVKGLEFCGVNVMYNYSTNWQCRIDTASSCLMLPGELYSNMLSWLNLYVEVQDINKIMTMDEIIDILDLPDLEFFLNDDGKKIRVALQDLLVDSDELVNFPDSPEIFLKSGNSTMSTGVKLCMLKGNYIDYFSSKAKPEQIVLGSLALRSLYVGIDINPMHPKLGFANKNPIRSNMAQQCALPITCPGSQYISFEENKCRNPDCRKYFFASLNEDTYVCEYDRGSIVTGIILILLFSLWEITSFFVYQYTSYVVIPGDARKFHVDIITLKIGKILTALVDKLIVDVLCWMPDDHDGNPSVTHIGNDGDGDVELEDDMNMNIFLTFDDAHRAHFALAQEDERSDDEEELSPAIY